VTKNMSKRKGTQREAVEDLRRVLYRRVGREEEDCARDSPPRRRETSTVARRPARRHSQFPTSSQADSLSSDSSPDKRSWRHERSTPSTSRAASMETERDSRIVIEKSKVTPPRGAAIPSVSKQTEQPTGGVTFDNWWSFCSKEVAPEAWYVPFGEPMEKAGPLYEGAVLAKHVRPVPPFVRSVVASVVDCVNNPSLPTGVIPVEKSTFPTSKINLPSTPFHTAKGKLIYDPLNPPAQATLPLDSTLKMVEDLGVAALSCANMQAITLGRFEALKEHVDPAYAEHYDEVASMAFQAVKGSLHTTSMLLYNATMLRREAALDKSEFADDRQFRQAALRSSINSESVFGTEVRSALPQAKIDKHNKAVERLIEGKAQASGGSSFRNKKKAHRGRRSDQGRQARNKKAQVRRRRNRDGQSSGAGTAGSATAAPASKH
jgi:hypothetical protein